MIYHLYHDEKKRFIIYHFYYDENDMDDKKSFLSYFILGFRFGNFLSSVNPYAWAMTGGRLHTFKTRGKTYALRPIWDAPMRTG